MREIIAAARKFRPDLVVLGEPNEANGEPNVFLGPVSQGLLTDCGCALRISRGHAVKAPEPPRLLVGFDGSPGADLAVSVIENRHWLAGTKVRLISIDTSGVLGSIAQLAPQMRAAAVGSGFASHWAETLAAPATKRLTDAGLDVSLEVRSGQPKLALLEAADEWGADCIFVAPRAAGNSNERFLLGSVSAAVAAHARCSVEVVRRP